MADELHRTLAYVLQGRLRERPQYQSLPDELLQLRHVALSGDGEPTLAPNFAEAVQAVVHVRALGGFPFFKIVLITNAHRPGPAAGAGKFETPHQVRRNLGEARRRHAGLFEQGGPAECSAGKGAGKHPGAGAPASGGHSKPVPGHQRARNRRWRKSNNMPSGSRN